MIRSVAIVVCVLMALASMADAHAVLTSPTAWNPSPSKGNPCGAGTPFTTAAATLTPGAVNSFTWKVVAGDGTGAVTVSIDSAGGTSFTTLATASNTITAVGTYTLNIAIPANQVCTGGASGNLCTLQFKSTSNWYSCTSVSVAATSAGSSTASATTATTGTTGSATGSTTGTSQSSTGAASTCTTAPSTLSFCTGIRGVSVDYSGNQQLLPASIVSWDQTVNSTYVQNLNSKLVFTHQHNDECYTSYKYWLCASSFPLCGTAGTGTCTSSLETFRAACGINATHDELFLATDNTRTTSDSMGSCSVNGVVAMTVSFTLMVAMALLAMLLQ